jgi:hypothetical protein
VSRGREDLAIAAGHNSALFRLSSWQGDTRAAAAVSRAGFKAAFTGLPQPVRDGVDPHRLGRWEPGPLDIDELLVNTGNASPLNVCLGEVSPVPGSQSQWLRRSVSPKNSRPLHGSAERPLPVLPRRALDVLFRRMRTGRV